MMWGEMLACIGKGGVEGGGDGAKMKRPLIDCVLTWLHFTKKLRLFKFWLSFTLLGSRCRGSL